MSLTASLPVLEDQLSELVDRLVRQEETTRRLEATLYALSRLPDVSKRAEVVGEEIVCTPRPTSAQTPLEIHWPIKRFEKSTRPLPAPAAEPDATDTDVLWATAGFVSDPLIGLDAAGRVRAWNPAAEVAFGWSASDVIGFPPPFLPDDKRAEQAQLLSTACNGDSVRDVATIRKKKDGTLVRVRVSAAGHAGGAAFVVRPELAPYLRPTLHAVGPQGESDSADAVAGMKRVIAAVVHDLNNLFTVVCGGSESLIERHSLGDPRRAEAEMVHAAGLHAARLVRQLTGLTTEIPAHLDRADLNDVVREMTPVLRGVLGLSRELIVDAAAPNAVVAADPARISQVILNLATNARDAMPGGGAVYLSTSLDESDRVVLTVRDTGPGIDPAVRPKVFERYVSTKAESRGIGLATVAEVVAQAGGQIVVESAPGEGTAIIIALPQAGCREPANAIAC